MFLTDDELLEIPTGDLFTFDVECLRNFFCVGFKHLKTGGYVYFEQSADSVLNIDKLAWMMFRYCTVGFNSNGYDILMIQLALTGASCEELKIASDYIIKSGANYGTKKVTAWDFEKTYKLKIPNYNTIDLFNVAPLEASLKAYAARLHCQKMQDLPYEESRILTKEEAREIALYNLNDLDNTELLFNQLLPEINLRIDLGKEYNLDLRSKSDAQLAEAVINSELRKITGDYPQKAFVKEGMKVQFNRPDFIKFKSPKLEAVAQAICSAQFELDGNGSPRWPDGLGEQEKGSDSWQLKVELNGKIYKLGMGGLHSQEKSIAHYATDEIIIADNDVESFYPRIILNQRLFPAHLGEAFLKVYEYIVNKRVDAKGKAKALKATDKIAAAGFKKIADCLKIVINGSFGKLGNKYSTIYAPQLMLQVTITGQLVLLMLIEMLEDAGIEVISGNTDGIISKYHKDRHDDVRAIIALWESNTNFKTEETRYKAVYSRDVNNYIAIKEEGGDESSKFLDERLGCKTKGTYCERGSALNSVLSKNPETLICSDAMLHFLVNETPLEETIKNCKDIRRFVSVRTVKGGGAKNGVYLGKVVRWYYAAKEYGTINYVISGNKVPLTDGAQPLMDLPSEFPNNIDYEKYLKFSTEMLYDCGRFVEPKNIPLFF